MFTGAFDLSRQRRDTNTLVVAFAKYEAPKEFAETDLGLLTSILEELKKNEAREEAASQELDLAKEEIPEAQRAYKDKAASIGLTAKEEDKALAAQDLQDLRSVQKGKVEGLSPKFRAMPRQQAEDQIGPQERKLKRIEDEIRPLSEQLAQSPQQSRLDAAIARRNRAQKEKQAAQRDIARDKARRDAALLRWRQAPAPSVSADEQINQLLLRNAIRQIQRR